LEYPLHYEFGQHRQRPLLLPLHADVAKHVRMDVQADVGHVIQMLAGDQPDNLANPAEDFSHSTEITDDDIPF
jgi:hypothetical protein